MNDVNVQKMKSEQNIVGIKKFELRIREI